MTRHVLSTLVCLLTLTQAQPDRRFDPFDWVLYRWMGAVNSITEGFSHTYFATESAGIIRYNFFSNQFEDPVTTAQGLSSNSLTAVHFDRETGILWAAGPRYLNFSYTREGDWSRIHHDDLGLLPGAGILQIGSSPRFVWCRTRGLYLKLDHASGVLLGQMTRPDEEGIVWSSRTLTPADDRYSLLTDYSVTEGWSRFGEGFTGPAGQMLEITTVLAGQYENIWVGTSGEYLFRGDGNLKLMSPLPYGLLSNDVQVLLPKKSLWVAGRLGGESGGGVTRLSPERQIYEFHEFAANVNMNPQSLYSILDTQRELWFGSEGSILIYDLEAGFWRMLDGGQGVPEGLILTMAQDSDHVWAGSTRGIARISKKAKRSVFTELRNLLQNQHIYTLKSVQSEIWIGTAYGLWIYSGNTNRLTDFREYGDSESLRERRDALRDFSALDVSRDIVYAGTSQGVLAYDQSSRKWRLAVEPAAYSGQIIRRLKSGDGYLWLATGRGLVRTGIRDGSLKTYNYDFMGMVNDLYITGDILWLGTSNGLVKFLWKKDL